MTTGKILYRAAKIIGKLMLVIILVAIVLNPSHKRFKEFSEELNYERYKYVFRKTHDYIIFSTFEKIKYMFNEDYEIYKPISTEEYTGCFFNFYQINN